MPTIQTPEGFLAECQRRGIKLTALGGTIKASGKRPANPEKFLAFLRSKKPELLALLASPPIPNSTKTQCPTREPIQGETEGVVQFRTGIEVQADPERSRQERAFELVATGRVSWSWGSTPVRICQGTTAEDPQRWVSLAFSRYCDLWRREADPEIAAGSPALHARAARDRRLLLESFMEVLAQGVASELCQGEGGLNSSRID